MNRWMRMYGKKGLTMLLIVALFPSIIGNELSLVEAEQPRAEQPRAEQVAERVASSTGRMIVKMKGGHEQAIVVDVRKQAGRQQVEKWRNHPDVEFVEPDFPVYATFMPKDPDYRKQWHHQLLQSESAWDGVRATKGPIVAVIDSGVDASHPDLQNKLVRGFNFLDSTTDTNDENGHGTHVAGLIAATFDNGTGGAGICPACKIMPLKVLDERLTGTMFDLAQAITYAADHGATIINMSLSGFQESQMLQQAVEYAWSKGVLMVASAGNNRSATAEYPAACRNVLAVAAVDVDLQAASFSNFGTWIDLVAPGEEVYSTFAGQTYRTMNGTSMAAPTVAGVAGLIWSKQRSLSHERLEQILKHSSRDLGAPGFDETFGYGLVQAGNALRALDDRTPPTTPSGLRLSGEQTASSVRLTWQTVADDPSLAGYEVRLNSPSTSKTIAANRAESVLTDLAANETYFISVRAKDIAGHVSPWSAQITAKTMAPPSFRHTVEIDGENDFINQPLARTNETMATSTEGYRSFVTWDDTYLYIGYEGAEPLAQAEQAHNKWVLVYIGGATGSETGVAYGKRETSLPFAAKYHVRWKWSGDYFDRMVFDGEWKPGRRYGPENQASKGRFVEFRVPLADIGNPRQLQLMTYMMDERTGKRQEWAFNPERAFHEFDLQSSVAAASQVERYRLEWTGQFGTAAMFRFNKQLLSDANNVRLLQSMDDGATWSEAKTAGALLQSAGMTTVFNLQPAMRYKFKLFVSGGLYEGSSAIVDVRMAGDSVPPTAPESLRMVERSSTAIRLKWQASMDKSGINRYEIFERRNLIGTATTNEYRVDKLQPNTTYTFHVIAIDAFGNRSPASATFATSTEGNVGIYRHSIVIDGNNDFNQGGTVAAEVMDTSTPLFSTGVTWDEEFLYIGYTGKDFAQNEDARNKWLQLYVADGRTDGTERGMAYGAQQPKLPFAATYHIRWRLDGSQFERLVYNRASGWTVAGTYSATSGHAAKNGYFVELRIPLSDIGNPKVLQYVSVLLNERADGPWMWAAAPAAALTDGVNSPLKKYLELDLKSGVAAASQVQNYRLALKSVNAERAVLTFAAQAGASGLEIQMSTDYGEQWTAANVVETLDERADQATVIGLAAERAYVFRLRVRGGITGSSSESLLGGSAVVSVRTVALRGVQENMCAVLSPPTQLQRKFVGTSKESRSNARITWTAPANTRCVIGYVVYVNGKKITATNATEVNLQRLAVGTVYRITVRSKDATGKQSAPTAPLQFRLTNAKAYR